MINQINGKTEILMIKCVTSFKEFINKIRTNRVSSSLLDNIKVKYCDRQVFLYQIANVTTKDSRTLLINVFDIKLIPYILKSIQASNLNVNPTFNGNIIYIVLPPLTLEYRNNMIKIIRTEAEQSKVNIRNLRRDANVKIKLLLKQKIINNDENYKYQSLIQKNTDLNIKEIDDLLINKEKQLLKF